MEALFCRKSVFSITFLVFFCVGTICGVLLLQFFLDADPLWLSAYGKALSRGNGLWSFRRILFLLWPPALAAAVGVAGLQGAGYPLLILMRGCTASYTAAAYYLSGHGFFDFVLPECVLLVCFYLICRYFCAD